MPDIAGNSLTTATTLNLTSNPQSFPDLVTPANNDYYRFALTTRSSLNLSLTGLDADANVELLDGAGNLVSIDGVAQRSANPGNFSEVINTTLDPGLYFIRVSPGTNVQRSNYILNISAQDNLLSTDLLWRNRAGLNLTSIWVLDGINFVEAQLLTNDLPANWVIGGIGDFNQDGRTDIIWRDEAAALTDIWFMNGVTLLSSVSVFPSLSAGWEVGGTGDFNKDGNIDIVWRNESQAATNVWFMDGATFLSSTAIAPVTGGGGVGVGWDIGAIGDFNQDGNLDLLWQNPQYPLGVFWLLNSTLEIDTFATIPNPDPLWEISGTGDFNQDGNLDLVWRYFGPEGYVGGWYMDRTAFTGNVFLFQPVPDPAWSVIAPYNTYGEPLPIDLAGNTFETALDLGKQLAGAATYRDRADGTIDISDFFQFNTAADARVSLSLTGLNADLDLRLYDANRTLIAVSETAGTVAESIIQQLPAGTYFLQVVPFSSTDSSTYALSLNINTPPVLVSNTGLTLSEQGTANLTNTVLRVTDADNQPVELLYTLGNLPVNGALVVNGVTATVGAIFTQADIDDGTRIRYIHNGSETTSDRFTFTVSDNSGGSINTTTFTIAVTPVNDPPTVISNTGLTLSEGAIASITTASLQFTDVDSPVSGLIYSVTTAPANGTLLLSGTAVTSFTQADLATGNVQYRHNGSETVSDGFIFTVSDGSGGVVTNSFTIGVTPVNDPPVVSTNLGLTLSEGEERVILPGLLQSSDPDNLPESLTYALTTSPINGTLLLSGTAVTTFTQADINSGNLRYRHNDSETLSDRFIFTITDGLIPAPLGPTTFNISVTPVNDPPIVTTNVDLTLSEGATAIITPSRLQVTDPEGQTPITYTLDSLPTNGTLRLGTQTLSIGQTFTQTDITNNQLAYNHNDTETTTDSFRFSVSDAAGAIAPSGTFNITILAVNDAPRLTLPTGIQTIDQETNTLIPDIRVTDVDLGTGEVTVTLSVTNGVLSLGRTTGINFLLGDGTEDKTLSFRGGQAVTNFVLQSLIYRSDNNFRGNDTINVTVTDGGNTGLGGELTAAGTIALTVAPVNDAPILTVPGAQTVREDTRSSIPGISIADPDAGLSPVRVSLLTNNGSVSLSSISGITLRTGTGTNDKVLVFEGTLTDVNRVLGGLSYVGDRDFSGTDQITISVSDSLNGSNGIPLSDTETIAITVTAQNDAPVITVPGAQSVNENTDLRITGIRIEDVDATGDLTVNLSTSSGRLSLSSINGLTFDGGDGTQDETLVFRGSQESINTALRTLIYRPNTDFNGIDTISINVSDGGSSGFGGVLGDSDAIAITVRGVNNPPVITIPTGTLSVNSDTNLPITGISISDPDVAGELLSVNVTANNGVLSLDSITGLNFSQGNGLDDNRLSFSGSLVAINAALSELTYRSYPGFISQFDRITISVNDNGNTGVGVSLSDTEVLLVNVGGAVNQVPLAVNDAFSVAEEGTLNANVLTNDVDPDFTIPLTAILVAPPTNALSFSLNANGSFTYSSRANFNGQDTFTYRAVDALNGSSNTATVVISVNSINDPPIAVNDSFTTLEDQPITNGNVFTNDTDIDSSILTAQLVAGPANASSFSLNPNGTFNLTPRQDFNGSDRFTYVVLDEQGGTSNTATVSITVTPVNDAPLARNDGPFNVVAGGTLTITSTGVLSNDTDVDTPLGNLTASVITNPSNGIVSLNPNGSFTYRPTGSFSGVDTFTYVASDGSLTSNLATVTISVGANNPPIAISDSFTLGEDGTLTIGNVLTNDTDPDGNIPLTATLVTAPANALSFTLNPDGTFSYQPTANFNGVTSFIYRAVDSLGASSSNPATATLTVTAVNDAPVAFNDTLSVTAGTPLTVTAPGILANDTDVDNTVLSAVLVAQPISGTLAFNTNGSFVYTANAGFTGTDSFTYRANDGSLSSATTATVSLIVSVAPNTLPIAAPDAFTTQEDTLLTVGNVLTNDTDPDNNTPLTASLVAAPTNALSFTLRPDGSFDYQPVLNFNGTDTFTYVAVDRLGGRSQTATVTFSVTPVNDAPVATNDTLSVTAGTPLTVTAPGILANDTDVDNTVLSAVLVAQPISGTLAFNTNGSFVYTANAGFTGTDSFTYRANDGSLSSATTATVSLIVSTVTNTVPIAAPDAFTTQEDTLLTVGNVLTNDTDPDNNTPLTASLIASPANALSFSLRPDGTFSYLPGLNFNGTDTFTYVAVDSRGGRSQTATVTFSVTPVNDAPVATNDIYRVVPAGTLNVTLPGVLANDTDVDGNPLTVTSVAAPTSATSFTLNADGSFIYVPQPAFSGIDSFTYQVNDGTTLSNLATVSIFVTTNQFPIASSDTFTTQEDTLLTTGNVLTNDTDPDNNTPLTASLITSPANALSFTLRPDGTFSYLPRLNFNGTDTFTYVAFDSQGGPSQTATVTFTVTPVSDPPIANDNFYNISQGGTLNITLPGVLVDDTDPDGGTLTATVVTAPTRSTDFSLNPDGSFTYTPQAAFSGTDSFTYRATDGTTTSNLATVFIGISNLFPTVSSETFTTQEDTLLTVGNVLTNDTDPDNNTPLTASLIASPANALSFSLRPDGTFSYLPGLNFNGTDTFTYVAFDSRGGRSQTATVTFSVTPVNDAPVAVNDAYTTGSVPLTISVANGVLANDTDVDSPTLTASLVTTTPGGALSLNPNGSFLYTPNAGFIGVDSFTYQAFDSSLLSTNTATVNITVTAGNNATPTANPDSFTTQEDTLLTVGNVLTNDTDPDNNTPLTASLIASPANALSFSLRPDGTFSYLPGLNFNGTDTFTYVAVDSRGGRSQTATVTFSVTPVNDLPLVTNDSVFVNSGVPTTVTTSVLANDTDPDGNPLTANLINNAIGGVVNLNSNGTFVYTPNAGFSGLDSFTYVANDGTGNSPTAIVTVRVNTPPVANNNTYTIQVGSTLNVAPIQGVLQNDTDPDGAALQASVVTNPTQGNLALNPDGSFVYNPNAGATGIDTFTYRASDGFANSTATVLINLRTNNAPIASNDAYRTPVNGTLNVALIDRVLRNDSDPDGDVLTVNLVTNVNRGALTLRSDGTFTYTPQTGFQGTDSFVYQASDGITLSSPATVTLTVTNNTPPVANNDTYPAFSGIPKNQLVPGVRSNDSDPDGDSLTIFLVSGAAINGTVAPTANGTVTLNTDGSFIYTSSATFQGTDTFVYRAFDGVDSSTATVTMSVTINNPPIAQPDTFTVVSGQTLTVAAPGVLQNDSDPENLTLRALAGGTSPANGVLLSFNSNGSFTYRPNTGFIGIDTFTYRASDGISQVVSTVTITVT